MGGGGAQIGGGGVGEGATALQMAGGGAAEACWSRQTKGGDLGEKMEVVRGGKRIGLGLRKLVGEARDVKRIEWVAWFCKEKLRSSPTCGHSNIWGYKSIAFSTWSDELHGKKESAGRQIEK
jgi:hypothetical protein